MKTILVVDDSATMRRMIVAALRANPLPAMHVLLRQMVSGSVPVLPWLYISKCVASSWPGLSHASTVSALSSLSHTSRRQPS